MRRLVSLAAAAAILASLTAAGVVSGAQPVYSTTVTVQCDGGSPAMDIKGRLYTNAGKRSEKVLELNGIAGYTWWENLLTCGDGDTSQRVATFRTKTAPTDATIDFRASSGAGCAVLVKVPGSRQADQACSWSRLVLVTLSTPVRS